MKRMLLLILAILLVCGLAACAQQEEEPREREPQPEPEVEEYLPLSDTEVAGVVTFHDVWLSELNNDDFVTQIQYHISNNTDLDMGVYHVGMLAYDENGGPLELLWNSFSTDAPSYFYLCDWFEDEDLEAGGSYVLDEGGWVFWAEDAELHAQYERIAYVLFEIAEIHFRDGSIWVNEEFDAWREDYEGQEVDLQELMSYYPSSVYL